MPPLIDMVGQKCGRLTVLSRHGISRGGRVTWLCQCSCGGSAVASGKTLRSGETKSCGCITKERAMEHVRRNEKPVGYEREKYGYIEIKTPDGFRRKHMYLMEQLLGRPLKKGEVVHHRDGNKRNNDISNLELMSNGEHTILHHAGAIRDKKTRRKLSKAAQERTLKHGHRGRKLKQEDVLAIRENYKKGGHSYKSLAEAYGVTRANIRSIVKRTIWRNI